MTTLKTTDYDKVNKSIEIVTLTYGNDFNVTKKQTYELMCLYYDYIIRKDTIDPISENEFTIRTYNILSDDLVIFEKDDFETNTNDEYQFMDHMLERIKEMSDNLSNILIYIDNVYLKYGVLFNVYRNIKLSHMMVNVFKYGIGIERKKLLNCASINHTMDFFKCYMSEALSEDISDFEKTVKSVSVKTKDRLIGICEQFRRDTFKRTTEQI